jgi:hypothetical protein
LHRSECLIAGSFQSFDVLLFTAACGPDCVKTRCAIGAAENSAFFGSLCKRGES